MALPQGSGFRNSVSKEKFKQIAQIRSIYEFKNLKLNL